MFRIKLAKRADFMVSEDLRAKVWERDKSICQRCHKKLVETIVIEPSQEVNTIAPEPEDVVIYKWSRKCWNCERETPVVSYAQVLHGNYSIGDIKKLDELLMTRYPFVKRAYSKTMKMEVIANTCIHCGSLQGNWFIMEDLIEMQSADEDLTGFTDIVLHLTITEKDVPLINAESEAKGEPRLAEVQVAVGEVHHKDGNWENNELSNLVLVCEDCHRKLTVQLRKAAKPQRSRKQARDERRQEKKGARDKQQADKWQANYYARKGRIWRRQHPTDSHPLNDYCADSSC